MENRTNAKEQEGSPTSGFRATISLGTILRSKLCGLRKAKEYNLESLAARAGISVSAISKLERGKIADPGMTTVSKLADALDVPVGFLLEGSEQDAPLSEYEWKRIAINLSLERYLQSRRITGRVCSKLKRIARAPGAPVTTAGWEILHAQIGLYNR